MGEGHWALQRCSLFEQVDPVRLARLEAQSLIRQFDRREAIYLPAEQAQAVLLLASGRVKIYHVTADGKESVLTFIEPGEIFGELALLDQSAREEYAEAMAPSSIILIPWQALQTLLEEQPQLSLGLTKLIGLRRRRIERRLKSLLFRSNRERLAHLLLELAERYGTSTPDGWKIGIRLSHQELASIIGSTRETVTLLLGQLQLEDLIIVRQRSVYLKNPGVLAKSLGETWSPPLPPHSPPQSRPGLALL